jgi:hypothetical protein
LIKAVHGVRCARRGVIHDYTVRDAREIPAALDAIKRVKPDGLIVANDPLFLGDRAAEIAAAGVPAISGGREFVEAGLPPSSLIATSALTGFLS